MEMDYLIEELMASHDEAEISLNIKKRYEDGIAYKRVELIIETEIE
ncbi:hypothetical protein AB4304_11660 [Vibrio breoganii]